MLTSPSHKVIRRSQTGSARPPAGKLSLQAQIPRFVDDAKQQKQQPRQEYGGGLAGDEESQEAPQSAPKGGGSQQLSSSVKLTVRFVITYSGADEIRDATLNISLPPGVSAEPSSALLPPLRGTGGGGGGGGSTRNGLDERGADNQPLVVAVLLTAERGTGFLPSSLVGKASVVYTRSGASDGGSEPMSARCDLRLPLALVARVVETTKSGVHKFTFSTNQTPVPLSALFEDMSSAGADGGSSPDYSWGEGIHSNGAGGGPAGVEKSGGGGAIGASGTMDLIPIDSTALSLRYWTVGPDASKDVSVAVSKNSGRYRVQSESLPAACLIATEVVRRLKDYFGESAERDRSGGLSGNGGKTSQAEGELLV